MQRPPSVTHEEEWSKDCGDIVGRARDLVAGRIGLIAAAQELRRLGSAVRDLKSPNFKTFVAINSESAHLPLGSDRHHWAPTALVEKDREIRALEDHWREEASSAARNLIEKYSEGLTM